MLLLIEVLRPPAAPAAGAADEGAPHHPPVAAAAAAGLGLPLAPVLPHPAELPAELILTLGRNENLFLRRSYGSSVFISPQPRDNAELCNDPSSFVLR